MNTRRVPAGVPAGGQFAPQSHPEPAFEILDAASKSARHWAYRYPVDEEELRQETVVLYLSRLKRAETGDAPAIDVPARYIHQVAKGVAERLVSGTDDSATRKGLRMFAVRRNQVVQTIGRQLTSAEEDDLAQSIIDEMPPRRRPSRGFHRAYQLHRPVSLDVEAELGREIPVWDAHTIGLDDVPTEFGDGTVGRKVEDMLEAGGKTNRSKARKLVWDAIAEPAGAPAVLHESISEAHASRCRAVVRNHGGASEVAQRWLSGTNTEEETEALFAPYAATTVQERTAVVETLTRFPDYTEELWDVSVRAATVGRERHRAASLSAEMT